MSYIKICEYEGEEPIELPLENDGTLLLTTLSAQFPSSCGVKYRSSGSNLIRGVRLAEGRFHPPNGTDWGNDTYVCVFSKDEDTKRKYDDDMDVTMVTAKTQKLESGRQHTCSDLIVLGLAWKTSEQELRDYFTSFGELDMVQVKHDYTGTSKGFGFIRFANIESQVKVLTQRHNVDGRWCDVKIPNSKQPLMPVPSKIFVGRISESITSDDLRQYFTQFGTVSDVFIPKPFRSFAFVTFNDSSVAHRLCCGASDENHIIKNCNVHINSASARTTGSGMKSSVAAARAAAHVPHHQPGTAVGSQMNNINPLAVAAALSQAGWGLIQQQQSAQHVQQSHHHHHPSAASAVSGATPHAYWQTQQQQHQAAYAQHHAINTVVSEHKPVVQYHSGVAAATWR